MLSICQHSIFNIFITKRIFNPTDSFSYQQSYMKNIKLERLTINNTSTLQKK